jgi:hypothetical protein
VWKQWRDWAQESEVNKLRARAIERDWLSLAAGFSPADSKELRVYRLIRSVRSALDSIVDEFVPTSSTDSRTDIEWGPLLLPPPQVGPIVSLDGDKTAVSFGPYGEFLEGLLTVQISRIRRCRICERLFYAERRDKFSCSPQCSNTDRQRRHRAESKKYEGNRERNKVARQYALERKRLHQE